MPGEVIASAEGALVIHHRPSTTPAFKPISRLLWQTRFLANHLWQTIQQTPVTSQDSRTVQVRGQPTLSILYQGQNEFALQQSHVILRYTGTQNPMIAWQNGVQMMPPVVNGRGVMQRECKIQSICQFTASFALQMTL